MTSALLWCAGMLLVWGCRGVAGFVLCIAAISLHEGEKK